MIAVTELKQWVYCARIVYYHQVMPGVGKATYKMKEALVAQDLVESLEMRRSLREYGLESAQREFGRWLADEKIGLSGKIDLLLKGPEVSAVVDFKLTSSEPSENHRMQLAGYAVLVEEVMRVPVRLGFIYRIPDNRVFAFEITEARKDTVHEAVRDIERLRARQEFPAATSLRGRCVECEYSNFCGDVW